MSLEFLYRQPQIHPSVYVAPGAVVIGDVEIGENASIWYNSVIRGDVNYIRVGEATNIQDGCILHVTHDTHPLVIENHVTIGHGVVVHGCTIRHHVLLGMNATVLDGAVIGEWSVVGAGTLIPERKVIPPGSLVVGVPGRVARKLTEAEREALHQAALNYIEYARHYRNLAKGQV